MDIQSLKIYCLKDKSKAIAVFKIYEGNVYKEYPLQVLQAWFDKNDDGDNRLLAANFCTLDIKDQRHLSSLEFSRRLLDESPKSYSLNTYSTEHLTTVKVSKLLYVTKYGINSTPGNVNNFKSFYDKQHGGNVTYYDSKSRAVENILANIEYTIPIAGTELVDFNAVKDATLEQLGVKAIEELLGTPDKYWVANLGRIIPRNTWITTEKEKIQKIADTIKADIMGV